MNRRTTERALAVLCLLVAATKAAAPNLKAELEELEVSLEFSEFDFEDHCIARNKAIWEFYTGKTKNLNELLNQEESFREVVSGNVQKVIKFKDAKLQKKHRRLLDILLSSGIPNLQQQVFADVTGYAAGIQTANVYPGGNLTIQKVEDILRTSKDPKELAKTWSGWVKSVQNSSDDLTRQLSHLGLEAEANGADDVEKYWLSKAELTSIDYKGATKLWEAISPLYEKLWKFLANATQQTYGSSAFNDASAKLLPVHLLGSLDSSDWITAADKTGAFKQSAMYSMLSKNIKTKKISELYSAADDTTSELRLGHLGDDFYKKSDFDNDAESCIHLSEPTCKEEERSKVLHCRSDPPSVSNFLKAGQEVTRMKHTHVAGKEEKNNPERNGYLLREGPKDSVIYEAVAAASTRISVNPDNLQRRGFINSKPSDAKITSQLLVALSLIPPMPHHLSLDLWRLQAIKAMSPEEETPVPTVATTTTTTTTSSTANPVDNIINDEEEDEDEDESEDRKKRYADDDDDYEEDESEDETEIKSTVEDNEEKKTTSAKEEEPKATKEVEATELPTAAPEPPLVYERANLTADWWSVRGKHQKIGPPEGELLEDYLLDGRVAWNQPHISKFLGPILLFQILEKFKAENTTDNLSILRELIHKGQSEPWESIVAEMFNITELDPQPLLDYFKPLEEFLDNGAQFQVNVTALIGDDFKVFLQATSLHVNKDIEVKSSSGEDSHAVMVILIGLAIIGSTAAVVSVVRGRLQKKKLAKKRRALDQLESSS